MTTHRINHVRIELDTDDEGLARVLLGRVSALRERRLAPVLDRVLSELSEPERIERIDTLELELGELDVDGFDDAFIRALEASLRRALRGRSGIPHESAPPWRRGLELAEIYARTGNLPWWADARAPDAVGTELEALGRAAPLELVALVHRLEGDDRALERLAASCEPRVVAALIEAIEAIAEPDLRRELEAWWGPLPARASTTAGRAALLRTLAQHWPRRESAARGRMHGQQRAERSSHRDTRPSERPVLLHSPQTQAPLDAHAVDPSPAITAPAPAVHAARASAAHVPATDDAPLVPPSSSPRRPEPEDSAATSIATSTDISRTSFADGQAAPSPPPIPTPAHAVPPIRDSPAHPERSTSPPERSTSRGSPVSPDDASVALDIRTDPHDLERPIPASHAALGRPDVPSPAVARARRAALESLEQLYLDDAGLVILWPFLPRFFERVGLLDEHTRFAPPHASMQAIALLEFLAAADPDPPEHRLALAKLLCGLAPDDRHALPSPLPPPMLAEAEHLLRAVIAHVPVLGEMSTPGFRRSFLLRTGALTTHQGAWWFQVSRETHDVVLERFGWAWTWVKLPWMPDPLRVEW